MLALMFANAQHYTKHLIHGPPAAASAAAAAATR